VTKPPVAGRPSERGRKGGPSCLTISDHRKFRNPLRSVHQHVRGRGRDAPRAVRRRGPRPPVRPAGVRVREGSASGKGPRALPLAPR
jgi:hypothetical protein